MLQNYFTLYHAAMELHKLLAGGHLSEIFSEHKNEITLTFITRSSKRLQLLIFTHTPLLCFCTREGEKKKPRDSARLMNELSMQPVKSVEISPFDREIYIQFTDETVLVLHLFRSDTNLFLVREQRIRDAFKHKNALVGQPCLTNNNAPGLLRELEPLAMNRSLFWERFNTVKAECMTESLLATLPGFDRMLVREIVSRTGKEDNPEALFTVFQSIFFELLDPQPSVSQKEDGEPYFTMLHNAPSPGHSFDSVLEGLAHYTLTMQRFLETKEELKGLRTKLLRQLGKTRKTLEGFNPELLDQFARNYEQCGHLLMASLYEPRTDRQRITVKNIFETDMPDKTIALKEAMTLQKNAEEYFSKASKTREKHKKMEERRASLQKEKTILEELLSATESLSSPQEARSFLQQQGTQPAKGGNLFLKNIRMAPLFRTVNLSASITLLVGKNAANNDLLTFSHTKPTDIWLHARGCSGSHCILKGTTLNNMPAIRQAAEIAAWYSSAKHSSLVPVIYTLKKYVRHGKKLAAGQVIVEREEVLLVRPSNKLFSDPA